MRVFFDTSVGHSSQPDDGGLELRDEAAVRGAAISALAELAGDYPRDPGPFRVVARAEDGRILFRAELALTAG